MILPSKEKLEQLSHTKLMDYQYEYLTKIYKEYEEEEGKKMKIKKWQVIAILEMLKDTHNCKSIDEAIELLNKELKDIDVAFTIASN